MAYQDDDPSQKTEAPTPRRLEKAREEGDVPISRELRSWAMLLVLTVFIFFAGEWFLSEFGAVLSVFIEKPGQLSLLTTSYDELVQDMLRSLALAVGLLFAVLIAAVLLSTWSQVGLLWAPKKLKFNPQVLNPVRGLKQKFNKNNLIEFLKSIAKLALLIAVGYWVLRPVIAGMPDLVDRDITMLPEQVLRNLVILLLFILVIYSAVVVLDILWQRYSYTERLRMTPQEVKDERKELEGNPEIKRRIARLRAERARTILTQAMRRADVVLTNPTHYAVALRYDQEQMPAPVVVAKGIDFIALQIRNLAAEYDVPLYEDPPLARLLYDRVAVEEEIDPSQYEAVAEVIRYVWSLRKTGNNRRDNAERN